MSKPDMRRVYALASIVGCTHTTVLRHLRGGKVRGDTGYRIDEANRLLDEKMGKGDDGEQARR